MALTSAERETIWLTNDAVDYYIVTTHNSPLIRKLRANPAAKETTPDSLKKHGGAEFRFPVALLNPRMPRRTSAETRANTAERMATARAARKANNG